MSELRADYLTRCEDERQAGYDDPPIPDEMPDMETNKQQPAPTNDIHGKWAIVEVFGHRSHAGRMSEVQVAGAGFIRIETPAIEAQPAAERPGSVTRNGWDEATARYRNMEVLGRFVSEAIPAVPAESYIYHPSAIFSIREVTQEQAVSVHMGAQGFCREVFVPNDRPALAEFPDPYANDDDEDENPFPEDE